MDICDMIDEIRIDLGVDINSLGISEKTISIKIKESIRKISSYSPHSVIEKFTVSDGKVLMPDDTIFVHSILSNPNVTGSRTGNSNNKYIDDTELFSLQNYFYNRSDLQDPYILLMQKNQLSTLQNFISLDDWHYDSYTNKLYINNMSDSDITVGYFRKYRCIEEVRDLDLIQTIKEYALALCKIVEGQIRRKLQSAPGSIHMDGDNLVSEGISEKQRLDEWIPRHFTNVRFGIRC